MSSAVFRSQFFNEVAVDKIEVIAVFTRVETRKDGSLEGDKWGQAFDLRSPIPNLRSCGSSRSQVLDSSISHLTWPHTQLLDWRIGRSEGTPICCIRRDSSFNDEADRCIIGPVYMGAQ